MQTNLENVRQRLNPNPGDRHYMVLADLRMFLQSFATAEAIRVLDFGAGTSPYCSLFPNADYRRADCMRDSGLDYQIRDDSCLTAPDAFFDMVLSTQVAEHVPNPWNYFCEAMRVLKPGGKIVVTTHGVWEDHGAPMDFRRWSADGLRKDLELAGFRVVGLYKITTTHRFHLFWILHWLSGVNPEPARLPRRFLARGLRFGVRVARPAIHLLADYILSDCRVVGPGNLDQHRLYCIIAAEAVRPTAVEH